MFKVLLNNIKLPTVPSTVDIKKEEPAFKSSFEPSKTTKPLEIVETELTTELLGAPNLWTTSNNVHNVLVVDGNQTFNGILTIREIIYGGRKADLVYINALIPHLTNKIHTYFSVVTTDGSNPTVYVKESEIDVDDISWRGFVEDKISRGFPEVDFNFPSIKYPNKFGDDIQPEDEWHQFKGEINQKNIRSVSLNNNVSGLINQNVIVPFYYLQAPLFKVFQESLNYRVIGNFVTDTVQQKRLFFSKENNLTAVTINEKKVYKHHLSIHPERYLPSLTVAEYLNALKNSYNLKIDIDHSTKTISLNYNEIEYFKGTPLNIRHYAISGNNKPKLPTTKSYLLKDASATDYVKVYANNIENSNVEESNTTVIQTKFKAVPNTITKEWEGLSGIGVLSYDFATNDTYHLQEVVNDKGGIETNYLEGENGIVNTHWLKWLRFRIEAKEIKPKMVVSAKQKHDVERNNRIYFNGQLFVKKSLRFKLFKHKYVITLELLTIK